MTYTGEVDSYGPPDFRFLPELLIAKMAVGRVDTNSYLLRCRRTDRQLLVDAADDFLFVHAIAGSRGLHTIVTTHRHPRHVRILPDLAVPSDAVTAAHAADADALPIPVTQVLDDGDAVTVGELSLTVLHLGGHTPGSIALLYRPSSGPPHLFTGDALLRGGAGSAPTERDAAALREALSEKVFDALPDDTWIYPGHGPDTTVGAERRAFAPSAS